MQDNSVDKGDCGAQAGLSLVVADSGLGGLSICADMARRLVKSRQYSRLTVVYFNAWPLPGKGYNFFDSDAERIRVFGNALRAMNQFKPNLICIACNTLSIILRQARLDDLTEAPVVDIIDFGVDMIAEKLRRHPQHTALLLGTRTTVASGVHKKRLLARGVSERQIAMQDCHGLASAIERDPQSHRVRSLIHQFMVRAVGKLPPNLTHLYAALCCTHYGYSQNLIKQSLSQQTGARVEIINPNRAMSALVASNPLHRRFQTVRVDIKVVSRVSLSPAQINSISSLIAAVSPETAEALRNYRCLPTLFDV